MAIPVYRQQVGIPIGAPGTNVRGINTGFTQGLGAVANSLGHVAAVGEKIADAEADAQSRGLYIKAIKDFDSFQRELEQDPDHASYGERFRAWSDEWRAANLESAGPRTQRMFDERFGLQMARAEIEIRDLTRRKQIDNTRASLLQMEDAAGEILSSDPFGEKGLEAWRALDEAWKSAAGSGVVTAEAYEAKRQDMEQRLGVTQVAALIEQNPYEARKQLQAGTFDELLQPEKKAQLVNAAEAEIKRREAEARARAAEARAQATLDNLMWKAGFEDELAFLQDGNVGGSGRYTPEEITRRMVAAYGPEKGALAAEEMIKAYERAEAFGEKLAEVSTMTPEEERAALAEEAEQLSGPEDYQAERSEVTALQSALEAKQKKILADPGRYAIQNSTVVREAYEDLLEVMNNPGAVDPGNLTEATERYAAVASAEIERLTGETGLPYLPNAYVTTVAKQFAEQSGGGEGPAGTVEALQGLWGDRWPEVYGQLVTAGALPAGAVVLGSGVPGAAAANLAEVLKVPMEDLKKGIPATEVTAAGQAVDDVMSDFLRVTSQYAGAETTVSAYYDSVERLTLHYMRQGLDAGEAADRAYTETLGGRFTFEERFFVPVEAEPGGEPGTIASNAQDLLDRLDAEVVDPAFSGLVPRIDVPIFNAPGVIGEELRRQYLSAVSSGGYWVTSPDQKGLVLHDSTGTAVTVQGKPLFLPWSAFQGGMTPEQALRKATGG